MALPYSAFLGMLLVLAAGCMRDGGAGRPSEAAGDEARALTDDLGREVSVPRAPRRVLTLAPNLTELLYAAGAGERLVAASPSDDFPPEATLLPRFSTFPLDREAVVALRPDLVLATDQVNTTADADALAALGVPTVFFQFDALDDVPRSLRTLGRLLNTTAEAERAALRFEQRIEGVRRHVGPGARPRVLLLVGEGPLYAFGRDSYASEAVRAAGGENLTDPFAGDAATPGPEWVVTAAPDALVTLGGPAGDDSAAAVARLRAAYPAWRGVPALRDGRVLALDPDLLSRPGPRLADGIGRMADFLHPERP